MNYPKVSFITTSFNNKNLLERTFKSTLEQDYPNIEHIVIDGGSTDGTLELLKTYEALYNGRLIWISESDKGIYDAINKGHKLVTGEYILFGSDPFINKHVITKMITRIIDGNFDGCFGGLITVVNNRIIRKWSGKSGNIRYGWIPATPTLCCKKDVIDKCGNFKTDYRVSADYEYSIRLFYKTDYRFVAIEEPLILFEGGGSSNGGLRANLISIGEGHKALKENRIRLAAFTDLCRIIRSFWQYRYILTRKEYTK